MENISLELTILMPCLNEHETICRCVEEALDFISDNSLYAEVLVADNGSTDGSRELAYISGARVIGVKKKGYGCALRAGIRAARGRYIIMGDSDGSYDLRNLEIFLAALREGWPLVMGNRFLEFDGEKPELNAARLRTDARLGGIAPNAMSTSHRLGVPALSALGRAVYGCEVGDFHCGLRGFDTAIARELSFRSTGMEFATEMIGAFANAGYGIKELPATLMPDGRIDGRPHLRTIRDGLRHLAVLTHDAVVR